MAVAAIPLIIMAVSTAVSVMGAIQQGKAAKQAADYNATINLQNAQIARSQAEAAAKQHERETYLRLGSIHAGQGHAGGAAGEGSVLDVLGDVAAQRELERQNIFYNAELQARSFQNTATLDTWQGNNAKQASYMKAGTELFKGVSNMYSGGGFGGAGSSLTRTG